MRVVHHPILGDFPKSREVKIKVDGKQITALAGEPIAAALAAAGIRVHRYTTERSEPRGIFCAIGQCTDCVMTVNGIPNVRTCIAPVVDGMVVQTQRGSEQEIKR
jgi:predicted molibdopterin-dependent oxidoreductase YjgC